MSRGDSGRISPPSASGFVQARIARRIRSSRWLVSRAIFTIASIAKARRRYSGRIVRSSRRSYLVVRARGAPIATDVLRRTVEDAGGGATFIRAQSMDDLISPQLATPRFDALLLSIFAVAAVVLAAVGLYGIMASSVNQQQRELGIRMALGATSSDVRNMWCCVRRSSSQAPGRLRWARRCTPRRAAADVDALWCNSRSTLRRLAACAWCCSLLQPGPRTCRRGARRRSIRQERYELNSPARHPGRGPGAVILSREAQATKGSLSIKAFTAVARKRSFGRRSLRSGFLRMTRFPFQI